jgi:hypothetical protein
MGLVLIQDITDADTDPDFDTPAYLTSEFSQNLRSLVLQNLNFSTIFLIFPASERQMHGTSPFIAPELPLFNTTTTISPSFPHSKWISKTMVIQRGEGRKRREGGDKRSHQVRF